MAAILQNHEQLGRNFYTELRDQPRYVSAAYHLDLCKYEGARSGTMIRAHMLVSPPPPPPAAAASTPSKTYRRQVRPNNVQTVTWKQ